jgi:hypothetical protein
MSITATYIGQSTVQVTTAYTPVEGAATLTSFSTIADTIADAIVGIQPTNSGTTNAGAFTAYNTNIQPSVGVTFAQASGITAQASSGWSLYDAFWGGDISYAVVANTPDPRSILFTQVFRSLNKDGSTYKYFIIRYNKQTMVLNTSSCESWNITTHQPVNEVWTHFDCSPIGFNNVCADIIVMVNPRWLCLTSFIDGDPGPWSGVFELEREDAYDTAAANFPCYVWLCQYSMMAGVRGTAEATPAGGSATTPGGGNYHQVGSFPRTKDGSTGKNALNKVWGFDLGICTYVSPFVAPTPPIVYALGQAQAYFRYNGWNSSIAQTLPFKPILNAQSNPPINYGAAYGLKMLYPIGYQMNKITVATDSDGNASKTGTNRSHWLLNNLWIANNNLPGMIQNYPLSYVAKLGSGVISIGASAVTNCVVIGTYAYITDDLNVFARVDLRTFVTTKIAAVNANTSRIADIKYDGERYVYIARTDRIQRLDIADETVATSVVYPGSATVAQSIFCMNINNKTLMVGTQVGGISTICYTLPLTGTFTTNTWTTLTTTTIGTSTTGHPGCIEVTHEGNFVLVPIHNSGTLFSTSIPLFKDNGNSWGVVTGPSSNNNLANSGFPYGWSQINKDYAVAFNSSNTTTASGSGWHVGCSPYLYKSNNGAATYINDADTTLASAWGLPNAWNSYGNQAEQPRYNRISSMKFGGGFFMWCKGSGTNVYFLTVNLLSFKSSTPNCAMLGSTNYGIDYIWEGGSFNGAFMDGSRIISWAGDRMKVIRGVGNPNKPGGQYGSTTYFAQFAVPV